MNMNSELESRVQGAHEWTWAGADAPVGSGLLVFSASRELLHINRQAVQWLQLGGLACQGDGSDAREQQVLPDAVTYLFEELLHIVRGRTEAEDWRQIEITSLIRRPLQRLLLRGFGIPDKRGIKQARIVMTVEEAHLDEELLSVPWVAAGDGIL